ncbi:hypothetical protein L6452_13733 [Arctium lappa]|uniref:Uncharacterized protein n=1 Tax=Arctium lappa TaxID=4217 RepID=A0ACB9CJD7_ARCLA|nr:hypothetical protein L6452_13733 [Arctium lappa]
MNSFHGGDDNRVMIIALHDLFPFVAELASELSRGLVSSMESNFGPSRSDVEDFMAFLKPLKAAVVKYQVILPLSNCIFTCEDNEIRFLYVVFDDLLTTLVMCLKTMESLVIEKKENGGWDQDLVILKEQVLAAIGERHGAVLLLQHEKCKDNQEPKPLKSTCLEPS